jgi:LmbE family N-acetylglucosaminyl deacetylase
VYPDARNPFAHPELLEEGFEPWSVPEIYLMTFGTPDVYVDITDTVERKVDALRSHASQMQESMDLDALVKDWGRSLAAAGGLPEGRLAEAFLRIDAQ